MRDSWSRIVRGFMVLAVLCSGTAVQADNPFGDSTVAAPTQAQGGARDGIAPPAPLTDTMSGVRGSNRYAPGDYQGYLVSHAILKATITFKDDIKDYPRVAWFEQILSEHGCKVIKLDKKETTQGNIFNRKRWLDVRAEIEGRGFVLKAIRDYYGGTVTGDPAAYTAPTDPALKTLVDLELKNRTAELAILQYSFDVDKLIIERSKLGAFDFSAKNRIDKALKDLKETSIPGKKAEIAANNQAVFKGLTHPYSDKG